MNLSQIARDLKAQAATQWGQPLRYRLSGGLHLVLYDTQEKHHLSLVRQGVSPSAKEIVICCQEFDVPKEAKQEEEQKIIRGQMFHIVRLIWASEKRMAMIEES